MKNKNNCKIRLGRHAEFISASHCYNSKTLKPILQPSDYHLPGRGQAKKAAVQGDVQGFTLIELLVVVLIIGILASIALPQYQKAVAKSRFAEALTNLKTIASANQVCHMETGTHCNLNELAVDVGQEGVSSHFYYNTTNDSGEENTVWATAQYREEDVCLCYLRTGEIKVNQNEGGCAERDASFDYAKLLNLSKVDYNVCGCC